MNSTVQHLEINLAGITSEEQLHELLMQRLEFPNYYGKNWDAFWDVVTEPDRLPKRMTFRDWPQLQQRLPDAAQKLLECLEQAKVKHPYVDCDVEYEK